MSSSILIRDFPGELVIALGYHLLPRDLLSLSLVSRRFASLLSSRLLSVALLEENAKVAFYWAVLSSNRSLAKLVLENGKGITVVKPIRSFGDKPHEKVLHKAPGKCDDSLIDEIMDGSLEFTLEDYDSDFGLSTSSPVDLAIKKGHARLFTLALDKGIECDTATLSRAAKWGNEKAVEVLLDRGVSPNEDWVYAPQPLLVAAEKNHVGIVRLLLSRGARVNQISRIGETALSVATWEGSEEIVKLLLDYGAKVNLEFRAWVVSAFHMAAAAGHLGVLRILLETERNVNIQNCHGWTPLHLATKNSFAEAMELLIANGADTELRDDSGKTPLECAGEAVSYEDALEYNYGLRVLLERR